MTLAGWLTALAVGSLAGAVSGLVGIGGGAIMVPFLYFLLGHPELTSPSVPAAEQAVVAHATSLLVIVPISLRGAWLYHRAGLVRWDAVWRMGVAGMVAAFAGARLAVSLPGELLKVAFGIFLLVMALQLAFGRAPLESESAVRPRTGTARALAGGAAVGFFSALLGVGGGLVAIPVLLYGLHVPMRKVSGTSLAVISFISLAGVISYLVAGWMRYPGWPGAVTYIRAPAGLALALGALLAVPLGTGLQRRVPTAKLRWMFGAIFLALGARIIVVNLLGALPR